MNKYRWIPQPDAFPKKNALTPVGALSFGIFGAAVVGATFTNNLALSWALFSVGVAPLLVTLWGFIYFAINDPDRLQTEDYRIQKDYVARIKLAPEDQKHIAPPDAIPISNPISGMLGSKTND